jgi:hypothetical protein
MIKSLATVINVTDDSDVVVRAGRGGTGLSGGSFRRAPECRRRGPGGRLVRRPRLAVRPRVAYSLQSVDSLPNPRAPRDAQAFVTGGAYALLFLLGALEGLIGCFQFSRLVGSFPLVALVLAAAIGVTCVLGAAGMGSAAGAVVPALGWFIVSVVLSLPTAGGSVIIANSTAGQVYLYGGSVCAAAGVVVAFLRRARTGPPRTGAHRTGLPRRPSISS